jgi:hypothetical protein
MSVTPSPIGGFAAQFFDNNGVILSGGKIYTYAAGTTTPQATYTSASGTTPHANPIILDSAGRVPGGEIWLTDGLVYKFVIETATAILIGTYDNITGINSNFVNYTIQEEVQTATAGQTVFNLTTINYTPATNSLTVYIDGVNQYVGDSYIETDSDTVTFTSGVHVGGEVKFTTAIQTTTGAVDASIVTYDPPFTGGVLTNVEDKLAQYVSVMDFGAVGDGVTDDTAAFAAAIAAVKRIYIPEGTYLVDTIDLLDVTGYTLEGASTTGTILKGKSTSSIVLNVRGSAPGGLNTYNTFKNFKVDTSAMDAVVPGAAIGINLINTWGNSFYNINVPTVSFPQRALYVQQHVYTTTFENCDFYAGNVPGDAGVIEINGFFPSITYSVTTLTFVGCLFAQCLMNYASGITFLQPIAQGDVNKFQMNNVSGLTIVGGDIEGTQTYLAFGVNCDNVVSLNNVLIGFTGTYKSGNLVSGYLLDQTNDPYYFINNNGTTTTAEMNGVVDEIATAGFITRKSIRNSNVTSQTVDIDFENVNGHSYVGMTDAGDTYIDNRASGSVALQQVGVDRVGVDAAGQLIINTTTAGTAGAVAGYIVFSNGVNTYKIPYHAV